MLMRVYRMNARAGSEDAFEAAAAALAAAVGACTGSDGVHVARVAGGGYLFIERWQDEAARTAAGAVVDKALFGALFATIEGKPETIDATVLS
jgi:quinol monooxygenase YgiN